MLVDRYSATRLVLPFDHFVTDFNNSKFFAHLQDQQFHPEYMSRVMKLDTESPIVLERIRGEPPLKVEGASQELQKDVVNRFR